MKPFSTNNPLSFKSSPLKPKEEASFFHKELENIKTSRNHEEGKEREERLSDQYKDKYPAFIKSVIPKIDNYLCFLKYPAKIKTNSVESLNSREEYIRMKAGDILSLSVFLRLILGFKLID